MKKPKDLPDSELIALLNQGSQAAFTEIYGRYWDKLLAVAVNRLGDEQEAEECVQDVFTSLWLRRMGFAVRHTLSTYFGAAIKYQVIKRLDERYLRHQRATEGLHPEGTAQSPEALLLEQELMERIEATVCSLPEKCRMVYRMSREEGKSNKAIAAELQISEKTVEGHITRALTDIRSNLNVAIPAVLLAHWSQWW